MGVDYDEWGKVMEISRTVPFERAELQELIYTIPPDSYGYAIEQLGKKTGKLLDAIRNLFVEDCYKG